MARTWDPCGQVRVCSDLDDIDPRRSRNVLKRPLACVHEVDIELTLCVLMDASGHAYAARFRKAFQTHGYIHAITEKKAGFKSLADTWADTTTSHGKLMLTVLGGLAKVEHELIRIRTARAGRAPRRTASASAAIPAPNSCAPGCVNTHSLVLIAIALG